MIVRARAGTGGARPADRDPPASPGRPRDAALMKIDPIHQFNIEPLFTLGHIGNHTIAFTNSSLYMLVAVAIISILMLASGTQLVPGRLQSVAEISYDFVAPPTPSTAGAEGINFFPLFFPLFIFICVSTLVGIPPSPFTISSHLIVTAALA